MSLRLKYGPHAGQFAEQVVLRDPEYCLWWLAERQESALANIFRGLISQFDERRIQEPCSRCGRPASCAHAPPGGSQMAAYCSPCSTFSLIAGPASVVRVYEDAVRHVALTCPRGHRIVLQRTVGALAALKGAPARTTKAAAIRWFALGSSEKRA